MKRYFTRVAAAAMTVAISASMIPGAFAARSVQFDGKAHELYATNVRVNKLGQVSYTTACKTHKGETFDNSKYAAEANVQVNKTVVAPTCDKNGYYYYTVSVYGDQIKMGDIETYELTDAEYKATGHKASGVYVYEKSTATCEEGGKAERYEICATCGEKFNKKIVEVEALGHDLVLDYTDALGNKFYKCARVGCNHKQAEPYAHTHVQGAWYPVEYKLANCTNDGYVKYQANCQVCNTVVDSKTETIKSLGHLPGRPLGPDTTKYVAPTCAAKGSATLMYNCWVCGKDFGITVELDKIPHTYQDKVTSTTATCTKAGVDTHTVACAVCGDVQKTYEKGVDALGHDWKVTTENKVEPTCVAEGYYQKVTTCKRCGEEKSRELVLVKATNKHTFSHKLVWVNADNTLLGDKEVITKHSAPKFVYADVCDVCGKVEAITAQIQATPDPYKTVDSEGCKVGSKTFTATLTFKDNKTGKTETVSETKTFPYAKDGKLEQHKLVTNTSVTKAPTCTEEGTKTTVTKCSVCGTVVNDTITETIPATGHKFVNGKCTECDAVDPNYVPEKITIDPTTIKSVASTKTTATIKVESIKGATGYQYKIWAKGDVKGATYAKANSTTKKFRGLAKNTTYKVKVRSYVKVGGNYTYSAWTTIKSVKTAK